MRRTKVKDVYKRIKADDFWGNLAKNFTLAFVGDSVASVMNLVVTVVLIRMMGNDSYGLLVLGQTYMIVMDVIINVQSWKGVIQYGQQSLVRKDYVQLGQYVRLGTILDLSTAAACGLISIFLAPLIGSIFHWGSELIGCAQIFSMVIFSHFAGTPTAVLRLANRFDLVAVQKIVSAFLKLVVFGGLFLTGAQPSLTIVTLTYVGTETIGNILLTIFAIRIYQKKFGLKYVFRRRDETVKAEKFIKFTLWGTIADIVDLPVTYFDMFIVSALGTDYVAIYKVFKQVINIFQKVTSSIQQSILPQLSELSAKNQKRQGFEVIKKIRNKIIKFGIPLALLMGVTSPLWLKWIYGDLYAENWLCLLFLLIVQILALSYSAIHPYFLALDNSKKSAIYVLIANVLYMGLAYILIGTLGLMAMAIAFAIQCAVVIGLKAHDIKKELTYE